MRHKLTSMGLSGDVDKIEIGVYDIMIEICLHIKWWVM
jgi:hypothetical protein